MFPDKLATSFVVIIFEVAGRAWRILRLVSPSKLAVSMKLMPRGSLKYNATIKGFKTPKTLIQQVALVHVKA